MGLRTGFLSGAGSFYFVGGDYVLNLQNAFLVRNFWAGKMLLNSNLRTNFRKLFFST